MTKEEREIFEKLSNNLLVEFIALDRLMSDYECDISESRIKSSEALRRIRSFLKNIEEEKEKSQKKVYMWKE